MSKLVRKSRKVYAQQSSFFPLGKQHAHFWSPWMGEKEWDRGGRVAASFKLHTQLLIPWRLLSRKQHVWACLGPKECNTHTLTYSRESGGVIGSAFQSKCKCEEQELISNRTEDKTKEKKHKIKKHLCVIMYVLEYVSVHSSYEFMLWSIEEFFHGCVPVRSWNVANSSLMSCWCH